MIFAQTGGPGAPQFTSERITVKAATDIPPNTLCMLAFSPDANGNLTGEPEASVMSNVNWGFGATWVAVIEEGLAAGERGEAVVYGKAVCRYTGSPDAGSLLHIGDSDGTVETGEGSQVTFGFYIGETDAGANLGAVFLTQANNAT